MEQLRARKIMESSQADAKLKLLVVSSYRRPCGIAQYVEALEGPLRNAAPCEIEIAALPVDLFRAPSVYAQRAAAKQYAEILRLAKEADVVNIQLEPGLWGLTPRAIWRRLKALLDASKKVIITYHTVPPMGGRPRLSLRPKEFINFLRHYRGDYIFSRLFDAIRRNPGKFHHIVQTRREVRNFALQGFPEETLSAHPLAFVDAAERAALNHATAKQQVLQQYAIDGKRIIGCFGFLSPYKGMEVAIKALPYMSEDVHLLIIGGLHPEGIAHHSVDQPYINRMIDELKSQNEAMLEKVLATTAATPKVSRSRIPASEALTSKSLKVSELPDLTRRVHFMGALDDAAFRTVMAGCDAVVLPYAEVGQTSSGPAAIALDLQRPVYCSHNFCFRELNKYQPGVVSFFEIGNYVEFAQKFSRGAADLPESIAAREEYITHYNVETRAALYWRAFFQLTHDLEKLQAA